MAKSEKQKGVRQRVGLSIHVLFVMLSLTLFLLTSCTVNDFPEADITIINANIYYENEHSAKDISTELLSHEADIYVLIEAAIGHNVDSALFASSGYTLYSVKLSSVSQSAVIASRISGDYGTIHHADDFAPSPMIRIPYNSQWISIVGVHTPAPTYSTEEAREQAFKALLLLGEEGHATTDTAAMKTGDALILCGDFNAFPSDDKMKMITDMGLEDGAQAGGHPYQYSWKPAFLPTSVARIDYLFAAPEIAIAYQGVVALSGSDHKAVITGITY